MTIIGVFNQMARRHSSWWLIALSGLLPLLLVLWLASLHHVEYGTLLPILAQTRGFVFFLSLWVANGVLATVKQPQQSQPRLRVFLMTIGIGFIADVAVVGFNQLILLGLGSLLLAHDVLFSWSAYWQFQLGVLPLVLAGQSIFWGIGLHHVKRITTGWWMVALTLGPTLILATGRLMFDWPVQLRLLSVFSLVSAGYWQTWGQVGACWLISIATTLIVMVVSVNWPHSS
ncbi:MAG TPA: hypothetical protein DCW31_02165 [Lactobacillus sp.]|nr:hypothetical protein [Lactobacillus sp.]